MVLISFWASLSFPLLPNASLFLSLREENKSTLLRGSEAMSSEKSPPESLRPFRDTCCSREDRSRPPPHGSVPTDAQWEWGSHLPAFVSSLGGFGVAVLKRELKLNAPSDTGLCLWGPLRLVLLVKGTKEVFHSLLGYETYFIHAHFIHTLWLLFWSCWRDWSH